MMRMNKSLLLLLISFCIFSIPKPNFAQKRELRAVWVATVANIDWPRNPDLPTYEQRQDFIALIDSLAATNFNAVVVQVRPTFDVFYPSSYEPWSKYLTGKSGRPPSPFYDPLRFMIDECHDRNMEFHAWINPLRAYSGRNPHPRDHVTYTHPDWFYTYGKNTIMNAGNPYAVDYLLKIIKELITKYDIDALHMDDYFYPYTISGLSIPDHNEHRMYNPKNLSLEDWRRSNITHIIEQIHQLILKENPEVQFGISPFGVWRNVNDDPRGSYTRAGQTNYDNLYADILLWMRKGWIDYCAPQLYWERGHRLADYNTLIKWWKQNAFDTYIIAGLQIYLMSISSKPQWRNTDETVGQINLSRYYEYDGVCLYSASHFAKNVHGLKDDLQNFVFAEKSLPPIHKHSRLTDPLKPEVKVINRGNYVSASVTSPSEKLSYILGYQTIKEQFVIMDINKSGQFSFANHPYKKFFICSLGKNQKVSEKIFL